MDAVTATAHPAWIAVAADVLFAICGAGACVAACTAVAVLSDGPLGRGAARAVGLLGVRVRRPHLPTPPVRHLRAVDSTRPEIRDAA